MRIISGQFKGRKIIAPSNLPVRPTTDQAKEALFNILENYTDWENTKVLDLCSGTGNISFECVSRGCESVVSVDINQACVNFQKKWTQTLGIKAIKIYKNDLFSALKQLEGGEKFDLIFADPPYDYEFIQDIPSAIQNKNLLQTDGQLIIEHGNVTAFKEIPPMETRKYGKVHFSFFEF